MNCPLCKHSGEWFLDSFYECKNCKALYRHIDDYTSHDKEKERYEEHNNDVNDLAYQKFVSPISNYVLEHFSSTDSGLDFGSGTGPVISKVLTDKGYSIKQYDPFFANFPELLTQKYDYIVCCEVMEHFHNPDKEILQLRAMLNPDGALICMTHLYDDTIEFRNWYYKNDPTHVFIYRKPTINYITKKFNFSSSKIDGRRVVFKV